jgi:hypothetical protein
MPYFYAPNSDLKRKAFLQTATRTALEDQAFGRNYLSAATVSDLEDLDTSFGSAYNAISSRLGERKAQVDSTEQACQDLKRSLRDLWDAVRCRVRREGEPVAVLHHYQLLGEGEKPNPGSRAEWISLAEAVIEGESVAVGQGYAAASYPGIVAVQISLAALRNGVAGVAMADRAYDLAQATMAELRVAADDMVDRIMAELRASLYREDEPSFRRIARTYGAEYRYQEGEEPDPESDPDPDPEAVLEQVSEPTTAGS